MNAKRLGIIALVCVTVLLAAQVASAGSYLETQGRSAPLGFDPKIKAVIDNITDAKILPPLEDLVNLKTRYSYSPKIHDAAKYIQDYYNNTGLETEQQCFFFGGQPICNVIGTKKGVLPSKDPIIVSGHYDSVLYDGHDAMVEAPGADDDASGTVAAMVIADAMKDMKLNETVKFIGWVAEEQGLVGASYYVDNIDRTAEGVKAIFQMDMIGNTDGMKLGVDFDTNTPSNWIGDLAKSVAKDYNISIPINHNKDSNSGGSDHAPFWAAGYQGSHIAETAFSPHWHKISDTIANMSTLNVARTAQVVAGMTATLAGVVQDGQGVLQFDSTGYPPMGNATLTLNDSDLKGAKSYVLKVMSSIDEEDLQLQSVMGKDSEFEANITLEEATSGNKSDGKLQVKERDLINSTYFDTSYNIGRNANATIDGVAPQIFNVTARDVTNESAAVYFETDEPVTAMVEYGTNSSLGSQIGMAELKKRQYAVIWDLENNTDYVFKVQATDRFGNLAESNNSGALYRFSTATLSIKQEMPGYAGWVLSSETSGNHFNDDDMYTGYDGSDTYMAAVQFKTDTIADHDNITAVSLSMATQTTGYMTGKTGKWAFQMLSPAIDNNFPTKTFSQISGAQSESNLAIFTANDIAPAWWNTALFTPTDLQRFLGHLQNNRISFRTNTIEAGGLADWDTGFIKGDQRGLGPKWTPRLNVFMNSSYATIEGATMSNGTPLVSAVVTVSENATGKKVADIASQVLGKYHLRLAPGKYDMFAHKTGYLNSSMKTVLANASDHITGVDFELEKEITAGTLKVIVRGESQPLKSAEVIVWLLGSQVANGTTDASGGFETVIEKGIYDIHAHKIGYLSNNATATIIPKTITTVTLDLMPANGWISGVVKDSKTDAPLQGVAIKGLISGQVKVSTQTDISGKYNLSVLVPRNEYIVNASMSGYLSQEKLVSVNSTWDMLLVKYVPPIIQNGTIAGKVVDEHANAIANAKVDASNSTGLVASKQTSTSGTFTFDLQPGTYTLVVTLSGYVQNTSTVTVQEAKQTDVTMVLKAVEEQKPAEQSPFIAIVAILLIIVILAILIVVLMMRRRKPITDEGPEKEEEDEKKDEHEEKEQDKKEEGDESKGK